MKRENILLAIHHHVEDSYSTKWIEYCEKNAIKYKLVNCYDSDIMEQLKEFDALLWHWSHMDYKAQLFSRQFLYAVEFMGIPVYPNITESLYNDDKVGEKYLLESINAPLIPSHVFYDKKSAMNWIEETTFPKIFKLRGGAAGHNVKLIHSKSEAKRYTSKAFGRGFLATHREVAIQDRIWYFKRDKTVKSFLNISRGIYRFFLPNPKNMMLPIEKNYLYAQDFIPNCDHDIRVFIIGDRAMSKKRIVRDNDFRASGSGKAIYEMDESQKEYIKIAFEITKKLGMRSLGFDFIKDENGEPKIIEICYAIGIVGFLKSTGYWTKDLEWVETGKVVIEDFIIEDFLDAMENKK